MFELRLDLVAMGVVLVLAPLFIAPFSLRAQADADDEPKASPSPAPPRVSAANDTAWSRIEETVRAEIAGRWDLDVVQVVLEWGPRTGVGAIDASVPPELVGSGAAGQWVVRLDGERGTVGVRVRAGFIAPVPIAATAMRRGHALDTDDIVFENRTLWGSPSSTRESVTEIERVGWVTHRNLNAGDLLSQPAVGPPSVVHTGESVEVSWATGAIRLTLLGRALGSVRAGESVSVRLETGKRVRGVAQADGTVRVNPGKKPQLGTPSHLQPEPPLTGQPRLEL